MMNVAALREARGLSWQQLADLLADVGHPIAGVSRIGRGERRIDLGDLVALALVLGTTPAALMLPQDAADDAEVPMTGDVRATARSARQWLAGTAELECLTPGLVVQTHVATYTTIRRAAPAGQHGPFAERQGNTASGQASRA